MVHRIQLPNHERAEISREKIQDYLLSESHPVGRFKSRFFATLGFKAEQWQLLETALRAALTAAEAESLGDAGYGAKYAVSCRLVGPSGQAAWVRSLWIIPYNSEVPQFITAYPRR